MDINSLLSPTEKSLSNVSAPRSTPHSPKRHVHRTHSGGVKPTAGSPLAREIMQAPSSVPAHVRSPAQQPSHSSPLISPVPRVAAAIPPYGQTSSTQSMDTLADLASMQNHQPVRSTPPLNSRNSHDGLANGHRPTLANPRASFDIAMVDTPKQYRFREKYAGTSLQEEKQQELATLTNALRESQSSYDAHLQIIKILHEGFIDHIYPSSSPDARRDARTYDLLQELRQARENADRTFALGEEQWLLWLQDESILAQSAEERVGVVEKFRRAIEEEYGSPKIWKEYGVWVQHCYEWAHDAAAEAHADGMPDPERLVGRELFSWDGTKAVWDEAVDNTKHDMSSSHLVFNKYLRFRFPSLDEKLPSDQATEVIATFDLFLQTPHAEWDATFQTFSSFVSANFSNEDYEEVMSTTLQRSRRAKAIWAAREDYERAIAQAIDRNDKPLEEQAWVAYIAGERAEAEEIKRASGRDRKKALVSAKDATMMVHAVYARAELRFPSYVQLWDAHIRNLIEQKMPHVLEFLSRATRHCPWSGSLWKDYLLMSELADDSFDTVESIKHNATKTGMLDVAGVEEVIKVHDAWCGYLLRRARRTSASEEDADVAEMGIRTSIENVESIACKLDLDASFETSFRLQRKYIEYLRGQGRLDNARKQFDDLVPVYGKHYKFWLRFYEFEMQKAAQMVPPQRDAREGGGFDSSAPFAIAVLKQGLEQVELDNPAALYEVLVNHCEDFEDAEELSRALMLEQSIRSRTHERAAATAEPAADVAVDVVAEIRTEEVANNLHIGKRKRDDADGGAETSKRVRSEEDIQASVEQPDGTHELKRDREHASVLVQHVASETSELKVRQFFSGCGTVQGLKSLGDDDNSFIVEFSDADAAQYALSRDGKQLDETHISVILNPGSTLYVTNYPAAADEGAIRALFEPFGDIVSIRFPSLQGNKRRRFCYVEYKLRREAQAALALEGHVLDDLTLEVKISNPAVKKQRSEKQSDGRTVFVGQLPFKATEKEVRKHFAACGEVKTLNMPLDLSTKGRNRGIAFITFADVESADAATKLDGSSLRDRRIRVNIANEDKRSGSHQPRTSTRSRSPAINGNVSSAASAVPRTSQVDIEERRQRTIALSEVPDTVNEYRLRAVAEAVGPVKKVILKTNHAGALVEFENAGDAGKAALELDGFEISPDRHMKVTTEKELLQQKPEKKTDKLPGSKPSTNAPVKRPTQPAARRGGHLGKKTGLGFVRKDQANGEGRALPKKSNDDFRAMLGGT